MISSNITSQYSLVPETVFACKHVNSVGWKILAWECSTEELADEIEMLEWDLDDLQVLQEHQIIKGLNGYFLMDIAMSRHWLQDSAGEYWIPMEDELSQPDGMTQAGEVSLSIISIYQGRLLLKIVSSETAMTIQLSSDQDDLVDLVRFTQMLESGATPHLVYCAQDVNVFSVFPFGSGDSVRLRIRHSGPDEIDELIDIVISRQKLIDTLRSFTKALTRHPDLQGGWFCFDENPSREDLIWFEQCKSTLSAVDTRFLDTTHLVRIADLRKKTLNSRMLEAAENDLIDENLSERQGHFFHIVIQIEGQEGWRSIPFVKSLDDFLQGCTEEEIPIHDYVVVSEYRGRPVHKGVMYFGHTSSLIQSGWKYDRYHDCYRAPDEKIKKPAWSISIMELQRRESLLLAIVPSHTTWELRIYNMDEKLIHEESVVFQIPDYPDKELDHYNWGVGRYAESLGLIHGPFISIWSVSHEVAGQIVKYSEHHRKLEKKADEWIVKGLAAPDRQRPIIKIEPDYVGAYAWDENGSCIGIHEQFPDLTDIALIEAELDEEWHRRFEFAEMDNEQHLHLDWEDFHQQGLGLAFRLKALLGDRADIVYAKPYEDPGHDIDSFRFIINKPN